MFHQLIQDVIIPSSPEKTWAFPKPCFAVFPPLQPSNPCGFIPHLHAIAAECYDLGCWFLVLHPDCRQFFDCFCMSTREIPWGNASCQPGNAWKFVEEFVWLPQFSHPTKPCLGGEEVTVGVERRCRFRSWWRVSRNGAGASGWDPKSKTICSLGKTANSFFWHLELIFSLKFMTIPNPKGCKSDGDNRDQKYIQPLGVTNSIPNPRMRGNRHFPHQLGPSDCARGMAQSIEESFMKITEPPNQRDQLHRLVGWVVGWSQLLFDPQKNKKNMVPNSHNGHNGGGGMLNCEPKKTEKKSGSKLSAQWEGDLPNDDNTASLWD